MGDESSKDPETCIISECEDLSSKINVYYSGNPDNHTFTKTDNQTFTNIENAMTCSFIKGEHESIAIGFGIGMAFTKYTSRLLFI